jgi:hypothetical protein
MNRTLVKAAVVALCVSGGGCASYTQSKIDLTTQAEAGVALVRGSVEQGRGRSVAASEALRARLDAAFDQDVAARHELDAQWVIAHRKAYSVAVDAFDADRRAADGAALNTLRTLDAISAALAQLQQMHEGELNLTLPEVKR